MTGPLGRRIAAGLVAAVGLGLLVWLVPTAPLTGDGEHYVRFAQSGLQSGAASTWHARRVLAPWLVHGMPLDPLDGFHLLTVASLFVAALLTWAAARALTTSEGRALASIPLFFGTWAVAPNLREYALVDPLAWAFVAGIWLATVQRWWWLAALLGGIGVLARDTVAVAAIAAAAAAWRPGGGTSSIVRTVGVAAPSLVVVVALLVVVPGAGIGDYAASWWANGLASLGAPRAFYLVFASFGALWLLLPRGYRALPEHVQPAAAVFCAAALALPFVGSPERMEEVIFPAIVAGAVAATRTQPAWWVWAIGVSSALFVAHTGGDARIPSLISWAALATATILAVGVYVPSRTGMRRWRTRASRSPNGAATARLLRYSSTATTTQATSRPKPGNPRKS